MKKIITASIVAIMAVTAANADIASTTFVTSRTGDVANSTFVKTLETGKRNLSGAVDALAGKISGGEITINKDQITSNMIKDGDVATADLANGAVTNAKLAAGVAVQNIGYTPENVANKVDDVESIGQRDKSTVYPTVSFVEGAISTSQSELNGVLQGVKDTADAALPTATFNSTIANYSTTAQMNAAITDDAVNEVKTGTANGTILVDGAAVAVHGLGSAAYTDKGAYATAAQGTKADAALPASSLEQAAKNAAGQGDGEYALTMKVENNVIKYQWDKVSY